MQYDYIIVGSGAGGAAAAYGLVRKGARVLLLEKGDRLPTDGSTLDLAKVLKQGVFKSKEAWQNGQGQRFVPEEYFNLGGKTRWYGAALLRYPPQEFKGDSEFGYLPWPIPYSEFVPYYEQAERLLGVREFALEPGLRVIVDRLQRANPAWRCAALPMGLSGDITGDDYEARHFDGFASARGLKGDAESALLAHISGQPNLTIVTASQVLRLTAASGDPHRIAGVVCANGVEYTAGTILLAAGAMHSPRLLARYLQETSLATSLPAAAHVGRFFKRHLLTAVVGFGLSAQTDQLRKTAILSHADYPHSSVQPLGFGRDALSELMPPLMPRMLAGLLGAHAYGFFLQTEDGSDADNQVRQADGDGLPTLDYDPQRNAAAFSAHRRFVNAFRLSLMRAGYVNGAQAVPLSGTAHACGTLVAGQDPSRSVVDGGGRVHGMSNLYVVDGSVLPRSSSVNPALTIYAWALRVADRLTAGGAQ